MASHESAETRTARIEKMIEWLRAHPDGTEMACKKELGEMGARKSAFNNSFREAKLRVAAINAAQTPVKAPESPEKILYDVSREQLETVAPAGPEGALSASPSAQPVMVAVPVSTAAEAASASGRGVILTEPAVILQTEPEMVRVEPAAPAKHPGGRPRGNRTVRMTMTMTPETQRRLRMLCASENTTASDWLETHVNQQFADLVIK